MLGPVMAAKGRVISRGFTMVELMVVVALVAIILALAAPSFTGTLARKRMEGVASELATDIQYARSEAAHRNAAVGVVFGSNCYTVYVVGTTDATACAALGTGGTSLKNVQVGGGSTLTFAPTTSGAFIAFDPIRGMATDAGAGTTDLSGSVTVTNSAGNWQIRALVTRVGRAKLCSPNNTVTGLATDCT
jgi:type IV fimbrial biogenesis protein FimT